MKEVNLEHLPLFLVLVLFASIFQWRLWMSDATVPTSAAAEPFKYFQRNFLCVYLIMMLADWLQGPYVYALYVEYGFSRAEIGLLFVVGFITSGILGVFIGSLTDAFGRKLSCLLFSFVYAASCVTKHFNNFHILLGGRFLGGAATSLLFTAFDSWMVHEHHQRKFDSPWLSQTFARATFGNGIVAILAGILASLAAETFGKVAPFDLSIFFLLLGAVPIAFSWGENYGTSSGTATSTWASLVTGCQALLLSQEVLICGLIQSVFEGAMYSFVLLWTPLLPSSVNHGIVFACFMAGVMIGSGCFTWAKNKNIALENILLAVFFTSALTFATPLWTSNANIILISFILYEIVVGVYFSAFYTLRSSVVPDKGRSTVLNLYRLPLNAIVAIFCLLIGQWTNEFIFLLCIVMQVSGIGLVLLLQLIQKQSLSKSVLPVEAAEKELDTVTM